MKYVASYIPVMKEKKVLAGGKEINIDGLSLIQRIQPGDELWLMMGGLNSPVALGAYRKGAQVYQISYPRVRSVRGVKKVSLDDIKYIVENHPGLFYPLYPPQSEILEIISAWQDVEEAMKARIEYANRVRARFSTRVAVLGDRTKEELKNELEKLLGSKSKGIEPHDASMRHFLEIEKKAEQQLVKVMRKSRFYNEVFAPVEGVGPKIAARFIAGIERIERFPKPRDLSNYAGMLPRGREGRLPSRRKAAEHSRPLSRNSQLNTACFNLQEQLFRYGRNTELGALLSEKIGQLCPSTAEERKQDPELRRKYGEAIKQARILVTRHFLEEIVWPRWRAYVGGA